MDEEPRNEKDSLIPDSFKGTMTALTVCGIMEEVISRHYPDAQVVSLPIADGGEGSVDSFLYALGGQKIPLRVKGPDFDELDAFYGLIDQGRTAVIEMAACAGLPLAGDENNPLFSTTYGVGQLMLDAARRGAGRIILGLGGSATNDGGCGAAAAAGIRFLKKSGEAFIPVGDTLYLIDRIDSSGKNEKLDGCITACAMWENPLYGPQGRCCLCSSKRAERTCKKTGSVFTFGQTILRDLGLDVAKLPGAGAAGGMGAGARAFFSASLMPGIEVVLDAVGFEKLAADADLILTGEGRIDRQSLDGKAVVGVARRAKELGVPVVAVAGDIGDGIEAIYDEGVSGIFTTNRLALDFKLARERSERDLALTLDNLMRFLKRLGF